MGKEEEEVTTLARSGLRHLLKLKNEEEEQQ
jgi:hypothetical protein